MLYSDGKPSVLLLLSVTLSGVMAINLYAPSTPEIARVFATSGSNVQLTVVIFLVAYAVAQLVYGPVSDRYGRRAPSPFPSSSLWPLGFFRPWAPAAEVS